MNEYDEIDAIIQKDNELIAVFCGGVLEYTQAFGEVYRFDNPGTHKLLMKLPPFGIYPKNGSNGKTDLPFSYDYNYLMFAIKHCVDKATTDELKEKLAEIKEALISFVGEPFDIHYTHLKVAEFVKLYNKI